MRCGCENGCDCTSISVCAAENMLEELREENKIMFRVVAVLTARNRMLSGNYNADDLLMARDEDGYMDEFRNSMEQNHEK